MSKYSDIRIELGQDNSIVFTQLRCLIVDRETNTVLDSFEHHGQRLLSIAEYLRDERCPNKNRMTIGQKFKKEADENILCNRI